MAAGFGVGFSFGNVTLNSSYVVEALRTRRNWERISPYEVSYLLRKLRKLIEGPVRGLPVFPVCLTKPIDECPFLPPERQFPKFQDSLQFDQILAGIEFNCHCIWATVVVDSVDGERRRVQKLGRDRISSRIRCGNAPLLYCSSFSH